MYNSEIPGRDELPTVGQLNRSSAIAAAIAAILLVVAILPAEYGIDPTGVGRIVGLTEMGEIKMQLKEEAEADRRGAASAPGTPVLREGGLASMLGGLFVGTAHARDIGAGPSPHLLAQAPSTAAERSDETALTLTPGEGAEIKLVMRKGAQVRYAWNAGNGFAKFDLHGDSPSGAATSYKKGRSVEGDEGVLEAAFDGSHGWFWRNRTQQPVTIVLKTTGAYSDIKRLN